MDADVAVSRPPEDADCTKHSQVLGSLRERVSTFKEDVSERVARKASQIKTRMKQRVRPAKKKEKRIFIRLHKTWKHVARR